ncbi:MAG: hypothetical protein ABIB79_01150 [archaeon]
MNLKRMSFWDILAWIMLFMILIWVILKMLGYINTPVLVEYAPVFAAVYIAGWSMNKLNTAVDDIKELKKFKYATINEINELKINCVKKHPK